MAARRRGQDGLGGRIKRVQPGGGGDSPSRAGLAGTWPSRVKEADRGKVDGNACRPGLENSRKLQPVQYEQPARRRRPRASETGADLAGPEPQTSAGLGGREGCNRPRAPAPALGRPSRRLGLTPACHCAEGQDADSSAQSAEGPPLRRGTGGFCRPSRVRRGDA